VTSHLHWRRVLVATVVVATLVTVLVARANGYFGGRDHDGPLYAYADRATVATGIKPGEVLTLGMDPSFQDKRSAPVIIESAEVLADRGLSTKVAFYARGQGVGGIDGPLPRGMVATHGARLTPDQGRGYPGGDVLLQMSAQKPGTYRTEGVRVRYHRGRRRFEQTIGLGVVICVTPRGGPCPEGILHSPR